MKLMRFPPAGQVKPVYNLNNLVSSVWSQKFSQQRHHPGLHSNHLHATPLLEKIRKQTTRTIKFVWTIYVKVPYNLYTSSYKFLA